MNTPRLSPFFFVSQVRFERGPEEKKVRQLEMLLGKKELDLSKSVWHYHQHPRPKPDKDKPVKRALLKAAVKHPGYGYRRMKGELRNRLKKKIGDRLTRRLMRVVEIVGSRKRKSKTSAITEIILRLGSKANLLAARKMSGATSP